MFMIRKGTYAKYNGQEYKFVDLDDGTVNLTSHNPAEAGFVHFDNNLFIKHVSAEELEVIYLITTFAKYKGQVFGASSEENGKVLLATSDAALGESIHFQLVDKFFYSKMADLQEVELVEDITPYDFTPYDFT